MSACGEKPNAATAQRVSARAANTSGELVPAALSAVDEDLVRNGLGTLGVFGVGGGKGAWVLAQGEGGVVALRVAPDGSVSARTEPLPVKALSGSGSATAVATSAGDLWIADGSGLVLVASDGANARRFEYPAVATVKSVDELLPTQAAGAQWPTGVALSGNGHLFVTLSNANAIIDFDTADGTFMQLPLPDSSKDAGGVAVLDDGTVGITLRPHSDDVMNQIAVHQRGAWSTFTVPAAAFIASTGSDFVVGGVNAYRVSVDGESVPVADAQVLPEPAPVSDAVDGSFVGLTGTGAVVVSKDGTTATITAPTAECPPGAHVPSLGGERVSDDARQRCVDRFNAVASDGERLYFASLYRHVFVATR